MKKNSFSKGITIVEIVVAAGIIAVSVIGIIGAIQVYLKIVFQNTREAQAVLLLDETAEAIQYLRDEGFDEHIANKDLNTEYSIYWNGSGYEFGTGTIALPYEMTRTVSFDEVRRDSSDQIVTSGGTVDDDTRKAIITITWPYKDEVKTLSSEVLIHNIYEN
jgi:Tfp pilus assembly protein PilV